MVHTDYATSRTQVNLLIFSSVQREKQSLILSRSFFFRRPIIVIHAKKKTLLNLGHSKESQMP